MSVGKSAVCTAQRQNKRSRLKSGPEIEDRSPGHGLRVTRYDDGEDRKVDDNWEVNDLIVPYAGDEQANVSPTAAARLNTLEALSALFHETLSDVTPVFKARREELCQDPRYFGEVL